MRCPRIALEWKDCFIIYFVLRARVHWCKGARALPSKHANLAQAEKPKKLRVVEVRLRAVGCSQILPGLETLVIFSVQAVIRRPLRGCAN